MLEKVLRWLLLLRGSSIDLSDPGPYIHWCKPIKLKKKKRVELDLEHNIWSIKSI